MSRSLDDPAPRIAAEATAIAYAQLLQSKELAHCSLFNKEIEKHSPLPRDEPSVRLAAGYPVLLEAFSLYLTKVHLVK
jgi:hypothetical protein